jgi:lipopolysaccharide export system permease protein
MINACWVVLLGLPYQVYLFFPVACLLGALVGLGMLANHHELIVMRAAGVSMTRVTLAVFKLAIALILVVTVLGETWSPSLLVTAKNVKSQSLIDGPRKALARDVWVRTGADFIKVGHVLNDASLEHVVQFRFDAAHQLRVLRQMDTLKLKDGVWHATGVRETTILNNKTIPSQCDAMIWDGALNPNLLGGSQASLSEMNLVDLHAYIHALHKNHLSEPQAEFMYWQRVIQPITSLVMMGLAIPFVFGPLRSSTMGSKLLAGVSVGFGFHLINHFFGPLSQVLAWTPWFAAIMPTLLFGLLSLYLMQYIRK